MTYRQILLTLITDGTPPADIYAYLLNVQHLHRASIISLLISNGVHFRLPDSGDEISDERRIELQLLSISD